ncbi:MAG: phage head closure protein [Planctomycetota bacterium]
MSIRANVDARGFDQRVRFQRGQRVRQEATGEITTQWEDLITAGDRKAWARIDAAKANEPVIVGGLRSVSDYTVWIRADLFVRLGLLMTDRILWDDRPMNIVDIPDQQLRGRAIAIIARIGANDG